MFKIESKSLKLKKLSTKWVKVVECGKFFYIFASIIQLGEKVNTIIGTYECKIDAKARVMIPAPLKKQLDSLSDGFVLKRSVFQPCLELYPMKEWNELMQKVNKLNRFKKENNDFIRRFTYGVKVVEIDSAGRVLIPKDLVAFAKIEKEIVLNSVGNFLEVWDKDLYEKAVDDASGDFADLAERVMGGFEDE